MPAATYDLKQFEKNKASLFTDVETLPSLSCRRRCVRRPACRRPVFFPLAATRPPYSCLCCR